MKKNSLTSALAFGSIILLLTICTAYADTPSEPHKGNAIWVEPSTINLNTYTVGQKFNITLWTNMTTLVSPAVGIDTWSCKVFFNRTYLYALRAGYTGGTQSQLFKGLATIPVAPIVNNVQGFVWHSETIAPSNLSVPCHGSLFWVEFNVTALTPAPINFKFNITNTDTAIADEQGNIYPPSSITRYNGIVIPEFSQLLAVIGLMVLTLVTVILKKRIRKLKVY